MVTRRQFVAGGGVAGVLVLSGCTSLPSRDPDLGGEWEQVGRTATNTNSAPAVTLPDSLAEQWQTSVGSPPYVPPVIHDGTVYAGGYHGIYALDPEDGSEQWHRELDGHVTDGAAVAAGTILVPEHRDEEPHRLRALALDDGSDRWAVEFESEPFAPTVRDERVFLRTAEECMEVEDSAVLWRTELDRLEYEEYNAGNPRQFTTTIKPAVTADHVVVPDRHAVVALDPADGTKQWREELHGVNASPVAMDEQFVALGLDDVAVFGHDGREHWRVEQGRWGALAAADGEVYVLGANELTALALDDGEQMWDERVRGDVVRSPPAVLGDAVLTVAGDGVAFRREEPGYFGDRELLRLASETTGYYDHGGATAGSERVFVMDQRHGAVLAFGPGE